MKTHSLFDDLDPLMEWLAHPDCVQLQNPSDSSNSEFHDGELEQKNQEVESSIDAKMEKVSLVDNLNEGKGKVRLDDENLKPEVDVLNDDLPNKEQAFEEASDHEKDSSSDESSSDDSMSDTNSVSGRDDEEEDDSGRKGREGAEDVEEGELSEFGDANGIDFSGDEEEMESSKGPIRSKHEVEDLPPVPMVEAFLQPHHQLLPVGIISSIMHNRVIVEGSARHNPLDEGSILWVTDTRLPLGLIDELFGPVKCPYYVVRYNAEYEVPAGIKAGMTVSFVSEFASIILNDKELYKKGYDASGENDEEAVNEVEFSDDEKESEYKKSIRKGKRTINNNQRAVIKQEVKTASRNKPTLCSRQSPMPLPLSLKLRQSLPPSLPPPLPSSLPPPLPSSLPPPLPSSLHPPLPPSFPLPPQPSLPPPLPPSVPSSLQQPSLPSSLMPLSLPRPPSEFSFQQWNNAGFQGSASVQYQNFFLRNLVSMMALQQAVMQQQQQQQQFVSQQGSTFLPLLQNNFVMPFAPFVSSGPRAPVLGGTHIQQGGLSMLPPSTAPSVNAPAGSSPPLPFASPSVQFNAAESSSNSVHFRPRGSGGPYRRGGGRHMGRGGRRPNW